MTERIIDFLDALVATVGAVDKRYCLVEKRADVNGTNIPYKYKGNGNYEAVNVDGGSISYWRIVNSISFDVVDGNKAVKNLQASYPIRYVAMVRRDDINPLTFSQDVANVLEGRNKDLQTQLQAKNVNITVGSIDTDTVNIWSEEFAMPLSEPNYTRSMVMIDLTVTVIAARSCWESCDNFPDILQGFDWCDPSTYQRLTQEQQDCLQDFLCGVCADATVQLNGTTVGTVASGATGNFPVTQDGSPVGSWNGSAWIVPPCLDGTVENSDQTVTVTVGSGDTETFPDTPISANSDLVINQFSGVAKDLVVRYETQGVVPTTIVSGEIVVPDSFAPDPNRTPWVSNPVNANDDAFGNIYNFAVPRLAAQIPASTYSALDFTNDIIQRNSGIGNFFGYVTPANAGGITGITGIVTNSQTQWTIRVNGATIMTLINPSVDKDIIVKVERLASGIFKFYKDNTLVYTSTYSDAGILVPTAVASTGFRYMSEAHISV